MQGPPDNSGYMHAAYGIISVVYFGYALLLWRRNVKLRARARQLGMNVD